MPIELRDYQLDIAKRGVEILREHKILYLAMAVRCGKTLTSMYAAVLYGASNILFVTKKKVIEDIRSQWESMALPEDADGFYDIEIINYEQLHNYKGKPDLIICDESHCLSSFPKPALRAQQLKKIAVGLPIIYLSGTPTPESYSQLFFQLWISSFSPWAQYKSFYKWAADYVTIKKRYVYSRQINDYSNANKELIDRDTKHLFISFSQEDAGFTEFVNEEILTVEMSDKTYRLADKLIKDRIVTNSKGQVIMGDTAVKLMQKLHQIYSGTGITETGEAIGIDASKAQYIAERFKGTKFAVFYKFKAEAEALRSILTFHGYMVTESVEAFNAGDHQTVYISQIQSGREGLNLSKADALVFYNIDFSAVSYIQARARLQTKDRVTPAKVYWVFAKGGIEEKIYSVVQGKQDYTKSYFIKDYKL